MSVMVIDVGALDQLGQDLSTVSGEFVDANTKSDSIAGSVGRPRLADAVRNFAHKWDDRRKKIADSADALSQAASGVADGWREFDQAGADSLDGQAGGSSGRKVPSPT